MTRLLFFSLFVLFSFGMLAQESSHKKHQNQSQKIPEFVKHTTISGQWFLNYRYNIDNADNAFSLSRAYFTAKTKFAKHLTARITQDLTVDKEGADKGNVEMRLKYVYMSWHLPDWGFFSGQHLEFGEVHRPWLDYEEHINPYRVAGTMAIERMHIINSAGFGATWVALLGQKMNNDYTHSVSHAYPGTFGSLAIGVYNGGGYHALETNKTKNIETRLSLRPFGEWLPGLQITYAGAYGSGNTKNNPEFNLHMGFISYESGLITLTAQYFTGTGNQGGSLFYVDALDTLSDDYAGYSAFFQFKIPNTRLAIWSRYDAFETHVTEIKHENILGGLAYRFAEKSQVSINYNQAFTAEENHHETVRLFEIALEVHF